jgi:hypothetical protein
VLAVGKVSLSSVRNASWVGQLCLIFPGPCDVHLSSGVCANSAYFMLKTGLLWTASLILPCSQSMEVCSLLVGTISTFSVPNSCITHADSESMLV